VKVTVTFVVFLLVGLKRVSSVSGAQEEPLKSVEQITPEGIEED
jgi:hypothetical protein